MKRCNVCQECCELPRWSIQRMCVKNGLWVDRWLLNNDCIRGRTFAACLFAVNDRGVCVNDVRGESA